MRSSTVVAAAMLILMACHQPADLAPQAEQSTLPTRECGSGPVWVTGNTTMPRPLAPIVPNLGRCEFEQATVSVRFIVTAEGAVREAQITEGAGACIDDAVLEAYRNARYCPAERAGKAVDITFKEKLTLKKKRPDESRDSAVDRSDVNCRLITPGGSNSRSNVAHHEYC